MLTPKEREVIEAMAQAMKKYDELPGQKTWTDLATMAYNAYMHHREYELIMRGSDADRAHT